jgi:hypothetical protein
MSPEAKKHSQSSYCFHCSKVVWPTWESARLRVEELKSTPGVRKPYCSTPIAAPSAQAGTSDITASSNGSPSVPGNINDALLSLTRKQTPNRFMGGSASQATKALFSVDSGRRNCQRYRFRYVDPHYQSVSMSDKAIWHLVQIRPFREVH